jgi:hypothetical protein
MTDNYSKVMKIMKNVTQKHNQDKIINKRTKKILDKSIGHLALEKGHNPKKDIDIDQMINDYNQIFGTTLQTNIIGGDCNDDDGLKLLQLLNKSEQKQYDKSVNKYITL